VETTTYELICCRAINEVRTGCAKGEMKSKMGLQSKEIRHWSQKKTKQKEAYVLRSRFGRRGREDWAEPESWAQE